MINERHSKIGELRRTQLITTFGIGSIVDLRNYSVMISGQQDWKHIETITEERLQKKLKVHALKQPKAVDKSLNSSVPCVRFPEWVLCRKCKILGHIDAFGGAGEFKCRRCSKQRNPQPLTPVRFVVACQKGHLDDFPWVWWVHKGASCGKPKLKTSSTGISTALSSIFRTCTNCDASRSMFGIFRKNALAPLKCSGRRPWLKDRVECTESPVVLQRSSASVYFSSLESAISIPPFSKNIYKFLNEYKELYHVPENALRPTLEAILKSSGETFDIDVLIQAVKERKKFEEKEDLEDLRPGEYTALCNPVEKEQESDFYAVKEKVPGPFEEYISRIVLVHRLREVRALCGFSRISPESPCNRELSTKKENWLPAVEVNGEGIFVELSPTSIKKWIEKGGEVLRKRAFSLESLRKKLRKEGKWTVIENTVTPVFLLIHTFAHLIIQQLTVECGYSSASLRERLYANETKDKGPMHGFLIYTAAADSEGSLGGLVRQGKKDRFEELMRNTIEKAEWCSNDPLCIESSGQGIHSLNLAACHTCSLLPETSCEIRNKNCFLDRGVLIGIPEHPEIGYFSTLLSKK